MYKITLLSLVVLGLLSCKSEYTKLVEHELATNINHDSLIFGMKMGQTRKDFFTVCWQLNKEKVISAGTGNENVKYVETLDSTMDQSLQKDLYFYGIFDKKDVMIGMDMTYQYSSWAPWNEDLNSKVLLENLKKIYMKNYGGNEFITIDLDNTEYKAFVKVDGNRQILMYPKNKKDVVVKMEDLRQKIKK